jgi:hypothetical protein
MMNERQALLSYLHYYTRGRDKKVTQRELNIYGGITPKLSRCKRTASNFIEAKID